MRKYELKERLEDMNDTLDMIWKEISDMREEICLIYDHLGLEKGLIKKKEIKE